MTRSYLYDDLLEHHFEKSAFWGALAKGALKMAPTAAKAGLGYATGIPIGGAGAAGMAAGMAKDILPSLNRPGTSPSIMGFSPGARSGLQGGMKTASGGLAQTALHYGPYAGFMAAHALENTSPRAAHAINLASLGTLAASTGYDAIKNPQGRGPNAVDVAALLAMGGAEGYRALKGKTAAADYSLKTSAKANRLTLR